MSSVFDLDQTGADALAEEARRNPLDPTALPPPMWTGAADQTGRLLGASARAGRSLLMAGAPAAIAVDRARDATRALSDLRDVAVSGGRMQRPDRQPSTEASDWYFEHVVEGIGQDAVDHWTPDARTTGSAAQWLGTGYELLGAVPQIIGAPAVFLTDSALSPAVEATQQGASTGAAAGIGAVNLGANAIGLRIPAAWGKTLATRIATGSGSNLALGAGANLGSSAIAQSEGLDNLATAYDPINPQALVLDAALGVVFGVAAHANAPRATKAQRDALLAVSNADHFTNATLPGQPRTPDAAVRHQDHLTQAIQQVLNGEPANVPVRPGDFDLRTQLLTVPEPQGYADVLVALESGGRADARAGTSSATGLHQFTRKTWLATIRSARPPWAEGLAEADLLALRTDPSKSTEMERALRAENAAALDRAGVPATTWHLYAAHHFGAEGGVKFARADDSARMEDVLSAAQIKANPYLAGKTKAQAVANWQARARKAGARVADGQPIPRNAVEAAEIVDTRLAELEQRAQAGALPKTRVKALESEDAELVALLREQDARADVLASTPDARLSAAERELLDTRRVEIRQELEAGRAALGFANELKALRSKLERIDADRDLVALADKLSPETVRAAAPVIEQVLLGGDIDLQALDRIADAATPRAPEAAGATRQPDPSTPRSPDDGQPQADPAARPDAPPTRSASAQPGAAAAGADATASAEPGAAGRPAAGGLDAPQGAARDAEQGVEAVAARDAASSNPALQVLDDDGVLRPAAEFLAQADAEAAEAVTIARAIETAASCFLRSAA